MTPMHVLNAFIIKKPHEFPLRKWYNQYQQPYSYIERWITIIYFNDNDAGWSIIFILKELLIYCKITVILRRYEYKRSKNHSKNFHFNESVWNE